MRNLANPNQQGIYVEDFCWKLLEKNREILHSTSVWITWAISRWKMELLSEWVTPGRILSHFLYKGRLY